MLGLGREDAASVVGVVSIAHFISHVFLLAYPPLFPLLATEFGVSTARLGLLVTAIYVPQLLLQLPLGDVVDRIGAKSVLVAGLTVTSLSIAGSGLAMSYWVLLGFAFLSGIGQSVFHPADYALLDAVTTTDNEGVGFSAHTFGGYAGFAAAPLAIGTVGIAFDWRIALIGAGIVGLVVALGVALGIKPVHARQLAEIESDDLGETDEELSGDGDGESTDPGALREMLTFVQRPSLLVVFSFYLLSMMALVGLQSFTTVLAVEGYGFTESTANTLLTVHLASTAVGVIVGGPIADRTSFRWVVVGTFLLSALGVIVIVAIDPGVVGGPSPGVLLAMTLFAVVGLLFGLALPSRDKFANSAVESGEVGRSFGFFFTGLSLGAVISPAMLGSLIDLRSAAAAFLVVAGLLVLAATVVALTAIRDRR